MTEANLCCRDFPKHTNKPPTLPGQHSRWLQDQPRQQLLTFGQSGSNKMHMKTSLLLGTANIAKQPCNHQAVTRNTAGPKDNVKRVAVC